MNQPTIRYFGLIRMRKRTYLTLQIPVLILGCVVVAWTLTLPAYPSFGLNRARLSPAGLLFLDHLWVIALVALGAEILDTVFTLRAFRRKEAEEAVDPSKAAPSAPRVADAAVQAGEQPSQRI
jgi:hypothetical protein